MNRPLPQIPQPVRSVEAPVILGAPPARMRRRHWGAVLGFLLVAVLPAGLGAVYLETTAAPQYASRTAFSVRSNEATAPLEFLGSVTRLGGSSAVTDGRILYDFIRSQQMVAEADRALDLRAIWNRVPADWVFALGPDRPVEDLLDHWHRMTDIAIDPSTGILTFEARAFSPDEAQAIAREVLGAGARLVNALSDQARADAVAHAAAERAEAEARLRAIRLRLRQFRDREQEVDPAQNARVAIELLAGLEEQLTEARVQLSLLAGQLDDQAPRVRLLKRRVQTLEARLVAERTRLGTGTAAGNGDALSRVVGDYEELVVDRDLAQQAYTLALTAWEQAQAEARRRHRYLAAHVAPTLSEEAEYPRPEVLVPALFLFGCAAWAILVLVGWNLRDRRRA